MIAGYDDGQLGTAADRHRKRMAKRSRDQFASVADIGEIPAIVDPARRESCRLDLRRFLAAYFPHSTGLAPFSADHERVIERIQRCVLDGGRFVQAVYRGFAKTTISENTCIWAAMYGHRRYIGFFGATQDLAKENLESIKLELFENDLLFEDFPEVCLAVRELDGKVARCPSQKYNGELTGINWTSDKIVLPTIPHSLSSGAVIAAFGLTGSVRGRGKKAKGGEKLRPDFVILDDPQTDESAASALQVSKRMRLLKKSILKLGGHGKAVAAVINATIIEPNDLIEQLLDKRHNAVWQGERIKMVRKWPDCHESLWLKDYRELRATYDADDPQDQKRAHAEANAFYAAHREEMDLGAEVSWKDIPLEKEDGEVSAIQHAYNMLIDDGPEAFASECQNEPMLPQAGTGAVLPEQVAKKVNGRKRFAVPSSARWLVSHIDVHDELLFYAVAAITEKFTPYVIDYGTYPKQSQAYYALSNAQPNMRDVAQRDAQLSGAAVPTNKEAVIHAGIVACARMLLQTNYPRDDGVPAQIDLCLVDIGYLKETVDGAVTLAAMGTRLKPSRGVGIGAAKAPMDKWKKAPGTARGHHWIEEREEKCSNLVLKIDTNYWKSKVRDGLASAIRDDASITFFGTSEAEHRLIADHASSEVPKQVEGPYGKLEDWQKIPNRENHHLDNLVGIMAAASKLGARFPGQGVVIKPKPQPKRRHVSYL